MESMTWRIRLGLFLQFLLTFGLSTVLGGPVSSTELAMKKLIRYGYIQDPGSQAGGASLQNLAKSLRTFQTYAGLPVTGKLDKLTIEQFSKSRCGMPDISHSDSVRRRKRRYALQGTRWHKNYLTFKIENNTPHLKRDITRSIITRALRKWEDATALVIKETTSDDADIKIRFIRGEHGDGYAFDGPGGELAHAFYPHNNLGISGDAHFDMDEVFTHGKKEGTNLFWVAVHEFGHSLGLEHSAVKGAIMFPWYQGYQPDFDLQPDDISAVQTLYGRPGQYPGTALPRTPRPTRDPSLPDPCSGTMDAAFHGGDGQTYIFRGNHYWTVDFRGVTFGPEHIRKTWTRLPGDIDAVYQRSDGRTVFFKKSYFWVYLHQRLLRGPDDIRKYGLTIEMSNLDAAVVWGGNGKTYFFKGDRYWRYNDEKEKVDPGYPKSITKTWHGVPVHMNAALQWKNGKTYFFKKNEYYALDDFHIKVEPTYPKMTARYWMGCTEDEMVHFEKRVWSGEQDDAGNSSPAGIASLWTVVAAVLLCRLSLW